jgi:hypothetical protein
VFCFKEDNDNKLLPFFSFFFLVWSFCYEELLIVH